MRKFKEYLFNAFLVAILCYSAVMAYWAFWPYEVNKVETPIEIMNVDKTVMAGDWLMYKIKYDKKMDISGTLSRKIINNSKIDLADVSATSPIKKGVDVVYVEIPKRADPGKYYLMWSVDYKVNPIRTVTVSAISECFYVVEDPNSMFEQSKKIMKRIIK
jgi:hypothetical protein